MDNKDQSRFFEEKEIMTRYVINKTFTLYILLIFIGTSTVSTLNSSSEIINHTSIPLQHNTQFVCDNITVPDCVEVGDLLLLDFPWVTFIYFKIPGRHNEHGAIYVGNNSFVDAVIPVVKKRDYSHFYSLQKNFVILRVKTANESQRYAAAAWAESKVGCPYQHTFRPPWFALKIANSNLPLPTAEKFYCMELLWAAYYNQGIDIDQNEWKFPWWVPGKDILHDDDIQIIYQSITNSTEITTPFKGIYVKNKKIMGTLEKTIVIGSITIEAVTYNENVTKMDFYIDNVYKATDTSEPYQWIWDEQATGRKVIQAVSCDPEGNHYSTSVIVWKLM